MVFSFSRVRLLGGDLALLSKLMIRTRALLAACCGTPLKPDSKFVMISFIGMDFGVGANFNPLQAHAAASHSHSSKRG